MTSSSPLTLADLAAQPSRVDELAPDRARGLLVEIASLQPLLLARALAQVDAGADRGEPARLLTVPEAAERLAIPPSFLYELIRQGRVPAQHIGPKYVRVHPATVAEIQSRGLDGSVYSPYSPDRERQGVARPAATSQANASRARRASRRGPEHRSAVGAGRVADPRANGAAPPVAQPDKPVA